MMDINSSMDPRWGAKDRDKKAHAIIQTISYVSNYPLAQSKCLDIGCGSGGISAYIAPHVKSVLGIDPESWARWIEFQGIHRNLEFANETIETLSCAKNSFDVIICNQVYEHVPDPQFLLAEIHRMLKPGGYCYFAGPNLLFPIEPHIFWPFVHWLPRKLAVKILKVFGSKGVLDANSTNYWTLKKWFDGFNVRDVVGYIIKNPAKYSRSGLFWTFLSYIPLRFLDMMTWISPSFIFILRKPKK